MNNCMPKEQREYIEKIQKDCLESTNMTESEAYSFAFRCWQMDYVKKSDSVITQLIWERDIAISQLEKLGIGFGEKIEDEVIKKVNRIISNNRVRQEE